MIADDAKLQLHLEHAQRAVLVKHCILVSNGSKHNVMSSIILGPFFW
jgi:ABC-type cobalamin transport system ATPase subunit